MIDVVGSALSAASTHCRQQDWGSTSDLGYTSSMGVLVGVHIDKVACGASRTEGETENLSKTGESWSK